MSSQDEMGVAMVVLVIVAWFVGFIQGLGGRRR